MDNATINAIAERVAERLIAQNKPFLHLDEAAEYIGLDPATLKDTYRKKGIPAEIRSKRLVFRRADLDRYMIGDRDAVDVATDRIAGRFKGRAKR